MKPSIVRTLLGGLAGGAACVLLLFLTFAQFGGSGKGEEGLLFDPDTQSAKLIAIWKEIEPLPLLIVNPAPMIAGYVLFAVGFAFLYRSVAAAWPVGIRHRSWRLAAIIWFVAAFFEFQGPVNYAHAGALPTMVGLSFWALTALAEALAIVTVIDGRWRSTGQEVPGG